jgi:hypothetical protein
MIYLRSSPVVFSIDLNIIANRVAAADASLPRRAYGDIVEFFFVARVAYPSLFTVPFDTLRSPPHCHAVVSPHDRVWRVFTSCGRGEELSGLLYVRR